MKKMKTTLRGRKTATRKTNSKPAAKNKKKNFLKDVWRFRWLKKSMVGKSQSESLDLLDQWILKKKAMTLFF